MLSVEGIHSGYGEVEILKDVSLKVEKGEIVSVIGSNGSGKTTLLRTITGLLRPNRGTIKYVEQELINLKPHEIARLGIIHVPEGRELFAEMTVYENLYLGSLVSKEAKRKFQESLEWVYSMFPILENRYNQLAGSLSGGEQQMLAIARALMARPNLLLLDEVSMGLAPKIVDQIFKVIQEINKEGITILLVEQNAVKALEISHRTYVLETGKIVIAGESSSLLNLEDIRKSYLAL